MVAKVVNNAPTDEYGREVPPEMWMQKAANWMCPPDVMNDPNRQGEAVARGFGAIPALFGGYVMDELSPFDTQGSFGLPVPMLGLIAEGAEQSRYQQEHAEDVARTKEAADAADANSQAPDSCEDYGPSADDGGVCTEPDQSDGDEPNYTPADGGNSSEDDASYGDGY